MKIYYILLLLIFSCSKTTKNEAEKIQERPKIAKLKSDFYPANKNLIQKTKSQMIVYDGFSLCYSNLYKIPLMVTWDLNWNPKTHTATRQNNFRKDPTVENCASLNDYKNTSYDRGHMCPAEDMSYDINPLSESFYFTNIIPQLPAFNRITWLKLEQQTREWSLNEPVVVITGPIIKPNDININWIKVPSAFYRIIFNKTYTKCIAFRLNHNNEEQNIMNYVTTIDNIESETGINFLSELPDDIEKVFEKKLNKNF